MTFTIKNHTVIVDDEDADLVKSKTWRIKFNANGKGYVFTRATHHGKRYNIYLHHCIIGMVKGMETDHRNGDSFDNRRENLRPCTHQQNACNRRLRKDSASAFKGIIFSKRKQRWKVRITINKKRVLRGTFYNQIDAAKAYNRLAVEHYGEFARLNVIPEDTSFYHTPNIPAAIAGGFSFNP